MGVKGYEQMSKSGEEISGIFAEFPNIDAETCTREANKLFKPYLFFHWPRGHRKVELWSSCCNRHGTMPNPPRTVSSTEMYILYGRHNDEAVCPWCGRSVTLKETGRLGKRKKLLEYHPVVILKARGGNLYARAYWAKKDYQGDLAAPPLFCLAAGYIFRKGSADMIQESFWRDRYERIRLEGNFDPNHRVITEPFVENACCGYRYVPYTVYGLEEIGKSDFRYCQYEAFEKMAPEAERWDLMKYLSAAAIYPTQVEMLMKSGFEELVTDLVCRRRKNSKVINWNEPDYLKAFGLDKREMREYREAGADYQLIAEYKMLRNKKLTTSFADLVEFQKSFGFLTDKALQSCRKYKVKPMKLGRYLSKFCGGCACGIRDITAAWQHWKDYTDMAAVLGWDLKQESVLLPSDLYGRHDEAAREIIARQELETEKAMIKMRLNIETRKIKYNFELGDYIIRVATSAEEILREGKTLQHCVGGYAERHMTGQLTILFLRRAETPSASLYTIEMNGNRLVQIHGYQNERGGAPNPEKTMDWMLKPWLAWLKKGSPRKEDGSPKLPNKKKKENAA